MADTTLSTQEVAALLNVTETTIKRWADDGKLACIKTPGGHRKFPMKDVFTFADANAYTLTGVLPPPMGKEQVDNLQFAVVTRNYRKAAEIFLEKALTVDREGLFDLLLYLYRHQTSLSTIADEVLRPVLVRIGDLWAAGKLEVNQEHRASAAITEALIRLSPELHRKPSNGRTAVCACPENELHEIGLRSLAYTLEAEGWEVQYVGGNTPFETLHALLRLIEPDLVCLSFTIAHHRKQTLDGIRATGALAGSLGATLIVGGYHATEYREADLGCRYIASSIHDAVMYTRDTFRLKPGRKKKVG